MQQFPRGAQLGRGWWSQGLPPSTLSCCVQMRMLTQRFAQKELAFPRMEVPSKFSILGVMSLLEKTNKLDITHKGGRAVSASSTMPSYLFHPAVAWDRILLCSQRALELTMQPRLLCNLHHPPLAFLLVEIMCAPPHLTWYFQVFFIRKNEFTFTSDTRLSPSIGCPFPLGKYFPQILLGCVFLRFILCECCLHVCSCTVCVKGTLGLLELGSQVVVS